MKKFFLTAALLALTVYGAFAQDYSELGAKLEEYFVSLAGESPTVQNQECDFIIESSKDSLVRQYVTLKIYEHYTSSIIMGDEAVAVHIVDKWLASGRVKMKTQEDLIAAKMYAEFNRASLIGKNAPKIAMKDPNGKTIRIPASGRYNILFFYDTSCPTCKAETARIRTLMRGSDYKDKNLRLYAIYVGDDSDAWITYRNDFPEAIHIWDPKMESDWLRLYGVLGTPRMFLVNPDGVIIGRNLDTPALKVLLSREFSDGKYIYGEESQTARYSQMFATYGDTLKVSHILEIADYLAARTFGEGNIDTFKQVEGDLLYFLNQEKGEVYKDAIIPFVNRYIKLEDVWDTPEDKAQVVSLGEFLSEMTARTPVGSQVPEMAVDGTLRRKPFPIFVKGAKEGVYQLGKLKGKPSYVVFYSKSCSSCQEMLDAIEELVSGSRKVKVLLVDMDTVPQKDQILDTFDLTQLPFVIQLDKKGVVEHRYVQF